GAPPRSRSRRSGVDTDDENTPGGQFPDADAHVLEHRLVERTRVVEPDDSQRRLVQQVRQHISCPSEMNRDLCERTVEEIPGFSVRVFLDRVHRDDAEVTTAELEVHELKRAEPD